MMFAFENTIVALTFLCFIFSKNTCFSAHNVEPPGEYLNTVKTGPNCRASFVFCLVVFRFLRLIYFGTDKLMMFSVLHKQ